MLVQAVAIPGSGTLSWTVLGDDDVPVVPVDRFLAYLTDIGRSPNTVKAYAHDLKDYWEFVSLPGPGLARGPAGRCRGVRGVAAASPGGALGGGRGAAVGGSAGQRRRPSTASSPLSARSMRTRRATARRSVTCWPRGEPAGGAGGSRSCTMSARAKPYRGRAISLKAPAKLPRILTVGETQAILDACTRLRDRFFFALMHETGLPGRRSARVSGMRTSPPPSGRSASWRGKRERRPGQVRRPDGPGRR